MKTDYAPYDGGLNELNLPAAHASAFKWPILIAYAVAAAGLAGVEYTITDDRHDEDTIESEYARYASYDAGLLKSCNLVKNVNAMNMAYDEGVKNSFIEQILSFKSLVSNWDGYGAIPVGVKCASSAIKLLNALSISSVNKAYDIYPEANGSITMAWVNGRKERLTLSMGADAFSYYCQKNGKDAILVNHKPYSQSNIDILDDEIQSIILLDDALSLVS